uniref:Hyaluronan/mRNA-binding protein domain-containing protein n=1 Tax=Neogobius melanostomus TaxID=47308 RepID=A0A8C6US92_9GOBI
MLPDEYGCVVANRFGNLIDDDDADPFDLLNEAETDKKKKKKKRPEDDKKSRQKNPAQKESQRDRRVLVAPEPVQVRKLQSRGGPMTEEEGHRAMKRTAYGERRTYSEDAPQEFSVPRPSYEDGGVRVRGGFRGEGRGGGRSGFIRNPDNFILRGKREYDRHSGTGISSEEKRGGRGPWNWGSVDEAACELMDVTEATKVKSEESQSPSDEGNRVMQEEEGEMVVHVAVEMSLDEWKALQEVNRPKVEFNIRKAENKIPSKAKVIHESKHLEENLKNDLDEEGVFLRRSVNDITSLMDINFGSLGRPNRGGRGRGGPRGGGGGGMVKDGVTVQRMRPVPEVVRKYKGERHFLNVFTNVLLFRGRFGT